VNISCSSQMVKMWMYVSDTLFTLSCLTLHQAHSMSAPGKNSFKRGLRGICCFGACPVSPPYRFWAIPYPPLPVASNRRFASFHPCYSVYTASADRGSDTSDRFGCATLFYRVYDAVSIPSYFRTSKKIGPLLYFVNIKIFRINSIL
jgi:hypothetical protein